jgi:outer membrane protein with beta-barrel domain
MTVRQTGKTACVAIVLFLAVVACASANAEDTNAPPTKFSIGAFIGYRGGGEGTDVNTGAHYQLAPAQSYGLVADFRVSPDTEVELLWSQQNTRVQQTSPVNAQLFDVNVGYYQIGGSYLFTNEGVQPFMVASMGVTYFSPQQPGYQNETKFSFGIGGGVKVPVGRHFGLRLEARAYGTVLENNSSAVCTNGSCLIHVSGNLMWQYEANAGVYLSF